MLVNIVARDSTLEYSCQTQNILISAAIYPFRDQYDFIIKRLERNTERPMRVSNATSKALSNLWAFKLSIFSG